MTNLEKPRVALIAGDPGGIGPELVLKLLQAQETTAQADVLLVGDRHVLALGEQQTGLPLSFVPVPADGIADWTGGVGFVAMDTIAPEDITVSRATEAGGRSALRVLDRALALARDGVVDGVCFGPFNKEAMHKAGLGHDDELHYMQSFLKHPGYVSEINVLDRLWTTRVTSHIALKDVPAAITTGKVVDAVRFTDRTMRQAGFERPRIAVCALNPHAGDGGNFGREEIDVIRPGVDAAARYQIDVTGPWPSDTIFLKAKAGEVDAIVTMYHDQGQIAMKLMGFDRGVTVQGGLPIPVTTPAHGTAYDIAGRGIANLGATRAAFSIVCEMAKRRRATRMAA